MPIAKTLLLAFTSALISVATVHAKPLPAYTIVHRWPILPDGAILGSSAGVGVDSHENVLVFHRAGRVWTEPLPLDPLKKPTVIIFDGRSGKALEQWGAGLFAMPHGLTVDDHDNVWLTDVALQQAGVSRTVYTRTTVQPDGTVQSCVAEIGSGDGYLDAYTCRIIVKRAKFLPARWTDGTAVYGVVRLPVAWRVGGPSTYEEALKTTAADLDLFVNRLPKGAHSIVGVNLEVAADENGRPATCVEHPPFGKIDAKWHFPELVPIACQQVMTTVSLSPAVDASGKAVRSVQSVSVHLKIDH